MQCYICESERQQTAGLMPVVSQAAGICHECGVGLCLHHGHRAAQAGAPLLCSGCARANHVRGSLPPARLAI